VGAVHQREDSFRFLNGTPHIPALYACQPGLEIISKVGIERIRAKSQQQTGRIMEAARTRDWKVNTPDNAADRGGTVSVECPNAAEVAGELVARNILVDYRPGAGIRLSPHFYNRDDEIDFAFAAMEDIISKRAWTRRKKSA